MTPAFKTYFRDHLRSKAKLLVCLTFIMVMLTFLFSMWGQRMEVSYNYNGETEVWYDSYLRLPTICLFACACFLPITEFSIFKKRRNLDSFYALPISRRAMGVVHYLTGWLCLVVPFTLSYLMNFLLLLRYPEGFSYPPVITFYFLCLLIGTVTYSIFVFFFNQANSTGDGIWFIILWFFMLALVIASYNNVIASVYEFWIWEDNGDSVWSDPAYSDWCSKYQLDGYFSTPYSWLSSTLDIYSGLTEKAGQRYYSDMFYWEFYASYAVWSVFGLASVFGFVYSFGKRKTEKTQEVSDSWFGYKVLIPAYVVLLNIMSDSELFIYVLILSFIGYVIYRKGFHLKKSDWIFLVAQLPAALLLGFLMFLITT